MYRDPVVEEVHQIRQKLLDECGGDFDRYLDRVKAGEKNHRDLLVTKTPVPARTHVVKESRVPRGAGNQTYSPQCSLHSASLY